MLVMFVSSKNPWPEVISGPPGAPFVAYYNLPGWIVANWTYSFDQRSGPF
jgi:hypothetical protein